MVAVVQSSHVSSTKTVVLTNLTKRDVTVTAKAISSGTIIPLALSNGSNGPPTKLLTGVKYSIEVKGTNMRGVLLRLEDKGTPKKDLTENFDPGVNTQFADVCSAPIAGLTHTSSANKNLVSGKLEMDTARALSLDVSVVFVNDNTNAIHSYDQFSLIFQAPNTAPGSAPVKAPITTPVEEECKGSILFRLLCLFFSLFR